MMYKSVQFPGLPVSEHGHSLYVIEASAHKKAVCGQEPGT